MRTTFCLLTRCYTYSLYVQFDFRYFSFGLCLGKTECSLALGHIILGIDILENEYVQEEGNTDSE